jgi:hypothetical protein
VRNEVLGHECENAGSKENKIGGRMTEECQVNKNTGAKHEQKQKAI